MPEKGLWRMAPKKEATDKVYVLPQNTCHEESLMDADPGKPEYTVREGEVL
jgi:hypothetical protein